MSIDGYDFIQTPTKSSFGGVGMYIKSGYDYKVREDLSNSIHMVAESVFIEISKNSTKSMLIGCLYRHHSAVTDFINSFLLEVLTNIGKEKNKICALLGDFNVDLLKFALLKTSTLETSLTLYLRMASDLLFCNPRGLLQLPQP